MSAIKPHLAEDDQSTDEELDYWDCATEKPQGRGLGRITVDEDAPALCPTPSEVLDFSHSGLMNMVYVRKVVAGEFAGARIAPAVDGKGEVFLWVDKMIGAPAWNPAPGGDRNSGRLLSWTTKMGTPSFSLPAGPGAIGGACPGSVAGMSISSLPARQKAAKTVLHVLGRDASDPIDPAECVCQFCYAEGGQYSTGSVQFAQVLRLLWVEKAIHVNMEGKQVEPHESMFVTVMVEAIKNADFKSKSEPAHWSGRKFFRLHDSGDFFSIPYLAAWKAVTNHFPEITFWAPTRIWALGGKVIEAVNEINGDAKTSNLVIRPSAFEVNRHGPVQQKLGRGWSAATTVYRPDGKGPDEGFDWDCKAYENAGGPTCRGAEAPPDHGDPQRTKRTGCRACWVHTDLRVNYTLH